MAKKNNIPKVEAPVVEKPEGTEAPGNAEGAIQHARENLPGMPDAMSQHDKVQYAAVLQHRKDEMLRAGSQNPEKYEALTMIEDAIILDTAITEAIIRRNPTGLIITSNEKNWKMMQLMAVDLGVSLPEFKELPKPTKEQLALVGLNPAPGQVVLKLEDKHISAETKKQKKAEQKLNEEAQAGKKEYLKDHTKIETDEQLKEALEFQLSNNAIANPIERLITTAQFFRSYKEALATKAENAEAELAKVHEFTLADLLQDITTMVKPAYVLTGFGKRLCTLAEDANSVIPAFCGFKNCVYDKKTGKYKYDDETIAAFVRVLIIWYASSKTAEMGEAIKAKEENIKVLKKDEKANAKGIESETKKIAGLKSAITHFTNMMSLVTNPSFDVSDNLISIYNDKAHKDHISACAIVKEIMNTYYKDVTVPELEIDSALLNVQQRIGIILNLFTEAMLKHSEYSEENIFKLACEEEEGAESGEGEEKNS